ncbi:MAG: FAD-dependent oxidoreductase [Pseudomonadota bacterium]|nr:FAD-dependent oxidoreductase [Pseudomonadota bacterium]MDP1572959.1 FAD-dependent oxidoreductase [Pseudomonadota bacterium]MDP1906195.1 FAD-dependent oxidoreductase [Pseudomonadota bacterium]
MTLHRRDFLKIAGAGLAASLLAKPAFSATRSKPHVVVVGAGFGGATCAKYLRLWDPNIQVTLIEPNDKFYSCPMSNWVIGGLRNMDDLTKSYEHLPGYGIKMVKDTAIGVDADWRVVTTRRGKKIAYDRLVLAPGIEFMTDLVEGYAEGEAAGKVLHAWKAGPQTLALRKQLEAMPDGGVFVIASPPPPGRCVSGPYERASLVAHYFKQHKPRSKIIMLDGHIDVVSKGPMFKAAWKQFYPGMIEHRPNNQVVKVDHKTMVVTSEFEDVKADVINIVPKQRAGDICAQAGVRADSAGVWCPVNGATFESPTVPFVHVLGDSVATNMPKSAHVSNNQAKICAAALVELFNGREPDPYPVIGSTSYSATSDHTAGPIAVVMRHDPEKGTYVRQPGGGASPEGDEINFEYNKAWFEHIWADTLG